jgi:hypothetical protein
MSRHTFVFTNPRAAFTRAVRALTSSARARITVRWICAFALRCRTGPNSSGSILASRASVRASCRSSFRLLLLINCTFCACATSTWCPNSVNSRLTQGECVPVSRAIRLRGISGLLPGPRVFGTPSASVAAAPSRCHNLLSPPARIFDSDPSLGAVRSFWGFYGIA